MKSTRMSREKYRNTENEIRTYPDTVKEYTRRRSELLTDKNEPDDAQSSSKPNTISNPTERYAIRLVEDRRLARLRSVMDAVKDVYDSSTLEHQKFIELNYWSRPKTKTIDGIALDINVSVRTLYRYRNEIVYNVAKLMGDY